MNPTLQRQLQKHAAHFEKDSAEGQLLMKILSATYDELQSDVRQVEHVLSVTSEELTEANERLRRESARALQASESRADFFRTLVSRVEDSIEVIDLETGRFVDMNDRAHLALGYTR